MKHPEWTKELSVGLHGIDSQHKQLFAISRTLHAAIESGEGLEAIEETFQALEAYVTRHFAEEEDYMRSIAYPGLKAHQAEHEHLMLRCQMLWNRQRHAHPLDAEGVAYFLSEWLTTHIMTYDKAIGRFVRSQE